jgi:hypothetical protein
MFMAGDRGIKRTVGTLLADLGLPLDAGPALARLELEMVWINQAPLRGPVAIGPCGPA